ncbi:MAG: serine/threonine-protein kinase, partial [Coxiellaceae bacterium]|nr:serine/threonine-protein kinase [Coxiellaceae bacterium]
TELCLAFDPTKRASVAVAQSAIEALDDKAFNAKPRFGVIKHLGAGAMGTVVKYSNNGKPVAIKTATSEYEKDLLNEIQCHRQFSASQHIARFISANETPFFMQLQIEFCDNRDLSYHIDEQSLPDAYFKPITIGILKGLQTMHAAGVWHCDIKPANVLLNKLWQPKISDFGLAMFARDAKRRKEAVGTPSFVAPEIINGPCYTEKADIYSFGILFHLMATSLDAYAHSYSESLFLTNVANGSLRPSFSERQEINPDVKTLIVLCERYHHQQRLTASEALSTAEMMNTSRFIMRFKP